MKIFYKLSTALIAIAVMAFSFSACNKLELEPVPNTEYGASALPTLATLLNDPSFSLLKAAATKAGLIPALSATDSRYTVFAPDDAAMAASLSPLLPPGVTPAMYVASLSEADAKGLVSYHVVPQVIVASSISSAFPNFQYPTILNPAPAVSPLLRLTTFPSVRPNGAWVNNVPITAVNVLAVNGVLHKVARIVLPPSVDLWSKIDTDADLTFLKAAIQRADSGVAAGSRLQDALDLASNPAAIASNLTIFAPVDSAMRLFITGAITQSLVAQGLPLPNAQGQATFLVATYGTLLLTNPAAISVSLAAALSPRNVTGLLAYHIISSQRTPLPTDTAAAYRPPGIRIFSVNIPSSITTIKTLYNSGGKSQPNFPNDSLTKHPGLEIQATFVSPVPGISVVAAATVKGFINATASNIIIGSATSDLHYVNGVIHKIDQVLLPQ